MSVLEALAIVGAGLVAGTINTIVGSGSLITFPTLLAFGFSPVVANVSNSVGLVAGTLSGSVAYRSELRGQRPRLLVLGAAALGGGVTGAVLLLALPGSVFRHVVPVLILVACVLVALQPRLSARLALREQPPVHGGPLLFVTVFLTGVYGGYFGAAQGVILLALLGIFLTDHLQRLNATKNVLALVVNAVAGIIFIAFAHVAWEAAGLLAAGSLVGGQLGGTLGRRIPAPLLRAVIVVVGVIAAIALLA
jgi:uncharacterized membrane protein YfcA